MADQLPKINDWLTATIQCRGMKGNDSLTERVAGYIVTTSGDTLYVRVGDKVRPVSLDNPTLQVLPPKPSEDAILVLVFSYFTWMRPIGKGAYPYDCGSKTDHPDAMVYEDERNGWTTSHHLKNTKNGYYTTRQKGLPKMTKVPALYSLELSGFLGFRRIWCNSIEEARQEWTKAKDITYQAYHNGQMETFKYTAWELFWNGQLQKSGKFDN